MPNQLQFFVLPALAYMLVASPATYRTTRALGSWVATPEGTAKFGGLVLHAVVFILLVRLLMNVFPPKRSGYGHMADITGVLDVQPGDYDKGGDVHRAMAPAPYA